MRALHTCVATTKMMSKEQMSVKVNRGGKIYLES